LTLGAASPLAIHSPAIRLGLDMSFAFRWERSARSIGRDRRRLEDPADDKPRSRPDR
jgi:hypothetical protein